MSNEKVGGIEMEAELDLGPAEKSVKSYKDLLESVNRQMGVTEKGFIGVEQKSKAAAGSIEDLSSRAKKYKDELAKLDPESKKFESTAKSLNIVLAELKYAQDKAAKSTVGLKDGMEKSSTASKALGVALGILGASSIEAVVMKMVAAGRESVQLAIGLQGVENRARAIFGDAFPQMRAEFDALAAATGRSESDLTEFGTSFASLMDSMGMSEGVVRRYSTELTALTVTLGRAFPEKSDAEIFSILEAGILGNVRGLRQLGITMKADQLQRFATSEGIKLLVKDMDDEQLMMLRTQYLLKETAKQQQAGAKAAGQLGDSVKTAGAAWKDLQEELGKSIGPVVASGMKFLADMLALARKNTDLLKQSWGNMDAAITNNIPGASFLVGGFKAIQAVQGLAAQAGPRMRTGAPTASGTPAGPQSSASYPVPDGFWNKRPTEGGGGGGKSAAEERKEIEEQVRKIEQDILKSIGEQAKGNLDSVRVRREELEIRKKMGVITKDEDRMLERINRRAEFQKDMVQEATKAWEDQVEALEDVEDKISDLNDEIVKEHENLQKTLADIDRDAATKRAETLADMVAEEREIDKKLQDVNLSGEERLKLEERRRELEKTIDPLRLTEAGRAQLAQADADASLDPLQKIDAERDRKKKEAAEESNARTDALVNELTQAQINRNQIVTLEQEKKQAVITALAERQTATAATYRLIEQETTAHVNQQIAEYARLTAALASPKPVTGALKRAGGGPVFGPGGPTDDKVPAWLSNGEYVVNARGYSLNRDLVHAINSGIRVQIPRFAQGGPVTNSVNNARTAHVTNHFHGDAARAAAPMTWFSMRGYMR